MGFVKTVIDLLLLFLLLLLFIWFLFIFFLFLFFLLPLLPLPLHFLCFPLFSSSSPPPTLSQVNLFFLLNIVRVLVTKLRDTHRAESNMYMKAVRATLILVPLLGIQFVILLWRPQNRLPGEIYDVVMNMVMHYQVRERERERERERPSITYCLFLFIYVNCACTFYVNMLWQRCIVCSHANKAFLNLNLNLRERERERERKTVTVKKDRDREGINERKKQTD